VGYLSVLITVKHRQTPSMIKGRCRGKFVPPGKFFPPPYCHNVTNANPNPNLNPSANPNPKFNPILTLTRTAACGNNFSVRQIFHYTGPVLFTRP